MIVFGRWLQSLLSCPRFLWSERWGLWPESSFLIEQIETMLLILAPVQQPLQRMKTIVRAFGQDEDPKNLYPRGLRY